MAHVQYVDGLVREYMMFRGFSSALKVYDAELKNDKDKSFRVDKIIDQITNFINTQDLQSLKELWNNLDSHLFSKLEHSFSSAVRKLEQGVLKLYLVTAHVNGKQEKVSEFFTKLSHELQQQSEWKEWFYFPFCKNPEDHALFSIYFTKQWQDTLLISLHNFLATIFQCMPQPTLSRIESETALIKRLQEENTMLRSRIQTISNGAGGPLQATFNDAGRRNVNARASSSIQSLNDISPPSPIVDDFYIIAAETASTSQVTDTQTRGLKSLIRNIGSGGSPVMGRKDSSDRSKRRSGSVGRNWV